MADNELAVLLALGAALAFGTSCLVYAEFAKRESALWMNCFKSSVACLAVIITLPLLTTWQTPSPKVAGAFMLSGLIGLNIADLFMLNAFVLLGASRTLILFGFQPVLVGISAYFLFGQPVDSHHLIAVLFLIGCLVTFSLEKYSQEKHWGIKGLVLAMICITVDMCGVLITRAAFAAEPQIAPIECHLWRCFGALIGFAVMSRFYPIQLLQGLRRQSKRGRTLLIAAAMGGTYLSLLLYLSAVKIGHLASISAVAITGPVFATGIESIYHRRKPSRYLIIAFLFFCLGFAVLLNSP